MWSWLLIKGRLFRVQVGLKLRVLGVDCSDAEALRVSAEI